MKRTIMLITVFIMALIFASVLANKVFAEDDWSVAPYVGVFIPMGSEGIVQDGFIYGARAEYKSVFIDLRRLETGVRYVGQSGIDLNFNILMLGFQYEFKPTDFGIFSISFAGGIALPDYKEGYEYYPTTHSEGLLRHSNNEASSGGVQYWSRPMIFDKYKVDFDIAPIVEIKLSYKKPLPHGSFFMDVGAMYLSVTEDIKAIDEPNINGGWRIINQLDCSAAYVMIGYKWTF